jgi:hypothetical protein
MCEVVAVLAIVNLLCVIEGHHPGPFFKLANLPAQDQKISGGFRRRSFTICCVTFPLPVQDLGQPS